MTVAELIKILSELDQDATVMYLGGRDSNEYEDIEYAYVVDNERGKKPTKEVLLA